MFCSGSEQSRLSKSSCGKGLLFFSPIVECYITYILVRLSKIWLYVKSFPYRPSTLLFFNFSMRLKKLAFKYRFYLKARDIRK